MYVFGHSVTGFRNVEESVFFPAFLYICLLYRTCLYGERVEWINGILTIGL
jgi:cell shape-determining protein MreD